MPIKVKVKTHSSHSNFRGLLFCPRRIASVMMYPHFISATRETAFLHAISSAAITHEFTRQCSQKKIPGCKCGKTRKQPKANSGWQWGGCSDDIKFGEKETKRFIDRLENGNDARTAFNLHNNEIGRKVNRLLHLNNEDDVMLLSRVDFMTYFSVPCVQSLFGHST